MEKLRDRVVILIWMILLPLVSSGQNEFSSLLDEIDKVQRQNRISSVVLIVTSSKDILQTAYLGDIDHDSSQSVDAGNYVRIGSVSKMFTAMALMRLVEQNRLSLNATVNSLVDTLPLTNPWAKTHPVRVAHLMEHTAGLTDMSGREFKYKKPLTLKDAFLVNPDSRLLRWPAGQHFSYSNSGSGIAAYVIESITNMEFESFVTQEVFSPLTLNSATYFPTNQVKKLLITGYDSDGVTPIPYWHTLYRAFGGINIKPIEMAKVVQMLMNKGVLANKRVFSEGTINRMETPWTTLAARTGLTYGYGLGLYHFSHEGFGFIGHGGDADGYLSYLAYSRDLDRGYFVSINAFNNSALNKIKRLINDSLIETAKLPTKPDNAKLSKTRQSLILGSYDEITYRFGRIPNSKPLRIIEDDGQLYTIYNRRRRLLVPVNEQHFRRLNEPYATIAILESDNKVYLQGDIGNFRKSVVD